jgi:hypothetical protein
MITLILITDRSANGEKSSFRMEENRVVFVFRSTNNELNIDEACEHLYQLYFDKDPPSSVFFDICGRVVELMAYHYPSYNLDAKSNSRFGKCSFISVIKDPILLYRWSERGCLITCDRRKKNSSCVYFSMCQMLHKETKDDNYICLSIMHIMCTSNIFAFTVYNTKSKKVEYWEYKQMYPYICRPDIIIVPNKIINYQNLLFAYYDQNRWFYKEDRLIAIDTHFPGDLSEINQTPNTYQETAKKWEVRRGLRNAYESDEDRRSARSTGINRKVNEISNTTALELPKTGKAIIEDNSRATVEFDNRASQRNFENVMKKYGVLDKDSYAANQKKNDSKFDAFFKDMDGKLAGLNNRFACLDEKLDRSSKKRSIDHNYDDINKRLESMSNDLASRRNVDRTIPSNLSLEDFLRGVQKSIGEQVEKIGSKASWDDEFNQSLIRQNRAFEQALISQKSTIDLENYKQKTAMELDLANRLGKANADLELERKKIELRLFEKDQMQRIDISLASDTRNAELNALERSNLLHTNDRLLNFKIESQRRAWDADDRDHDMKFESYRVSNRIRESYASTNDRLSIEHAGSQSDLNLLRARKAMDRNLKANNDDDDNDD